MQAHSQTIYSQNHHLLSPYFNIQTMKKHIAKENEITKYKRGNQA